MKSILFLLVTSVLFSCSTTKNPTSTIEEDKIFLTRKYVGRFLDYRYSEPERLGMPNIIWIKTSLDSVYGKISVYGKVCKFVVGDRLYLRRTFYTPAGSFGYWDYTIENNTTIYYQVTDYQYDKKILTEEWFVEKETTTEQ